MKRHLFHSSVLLLVLAAVVGCAAFNMPGPGGVSPGVIVTSSVVPGSLTSDLVYLAYPDSFVVKGMVEGSSSATNVLGLFSFGDAGYLAAIDDAKTKAGADGLINCVGDVKSNSVLGLFSKSTTIVRGLAIVRK